MRFRVLDRDPPLPFLNEDDGHDDRERDEREHEVVDDVALVPARIPPEG